MIVRHIAQPARGYICAQCRSFSAFPTLFSGHNRWSKIKHEKGAKDATKNKQRSQFAAEIVSAVKVYGPDPNSNTRLASAIATAKKNHFPKVSIESAIARGQGLSSSGAPLESVTIEAMLPPGVGVVVDFLTESKGRTIQVTRALVKDYGGQASPSAYLFDKKGRVIFKPKEGVGADDVLDAAIEAGAEDVTEEDEAVVVFCDVADTKSVAEAMEVSTGLEMESLDIVWDAKEETRVEVQDEALKDQFEKFVDKIMDQPGVQGISMNAVGDGLWERLGDRVYLGREV